MNGKKNVNRQSENHRIFSHSVGQKLQWVSIETEGSSICVAGLFERLLSLEFSSAHGYGGNNIWLKKGIEQIWGGMILDIIT